MPAVVQAEARPQLVERALLRRGEATLAQHEAAYLPVAFLDGEGLGWRLRSITGEWVSHRHVASGHSQQADLTCALRRVGTPRERFSPRRGAARSCAPCG